jgi:hypothetical protein
MPTSFTNAVSNDVGITEQLVYTPPASTKAILIGCNIANNLKTELPVSLYLRKSGNDVYIVKNVRLPPGGNFEVMRGNKLVVAAGDSIYAIAGEAAGADVIASVLEGVS